MLGVALRCWLISVVCSFSTRSELRAALLQWYHADEATKLQPHGAPGGWDVSAVTNMSGLFKDLEHFNENISAWDTSKVVDMSSMFYGAAAFNMPIGEWNTSRVQTMSKMFWKAEKFNQPIESWNTSAVLDMFGMFYRATSFDQPIGAWDTAGVRDMAGMFYEARLFNQPIGSWKTAAVFDMAFMFRDASSFDQPIGDWNTANVRDMRNMFDGAVVFNQPIGLWNTSAVTNMWGMFAVASSFDQPIGAWNTANVRDMSFMFQRASSFDQPIGAWDTAEARDMSGMFAVATSFNQPIGAWDTSRVKRMDTMFDQAVSFNQPLNHWDTGSVTNFSAMFIRASSFDQPLGMWDTSAATDMTYMFSGARSFNQPLSTWNFTSIPDETAMSNAFTGSGMSDCMFRASSEAVGLPPRISRPWAYSACPSCPCPQTNLACVDGACRPVNSGFIELGKGPWDDVNATTATAVGFRACAKACEASDGFAFLLEESGRCLLIHEPRLTQDTALKGTSIRGRTAFRRTSCSTFSCPAGTAPTPTMPTPRSEESEEVSAAACCRCSANQVRDRSKEPDLVCVVCPAGRAAKNDDCHACTEGYAPEGASECAACPTGEIPDHGRTDCTPCAPGEYADGETCRLCRFPRFLNDNNCIWWHLPLIVLLLLFCSALVFLGHRITKRRRRRWTESREEEVNQILQQLEQELWHEKLNTMSRFFVALSGFGWSWNQVCQRAEEIRARHSAHAGVSLAYLMGDFSRVAYDWSGEDDPTFLRLKEVFWQGEEKLGSDIRCPRDGRPGCALVDWLSPEHRQMQTHFMSWSWQYSLQQLQSAMKMWRGTTTLDFQEVFFYICFFVNNQFRIIVEGSAIGSHNLEEVFEKNLRRIGRVVAVLDTWQQPVYLQRVWTIYEQYVACSLQVPVTFVMPEHASVSLSDQISRGESGIDDVTSSLCHVNVADAQAFDPRDEEKVKRTIECTVGFDRVNQHVKHAMIQWIGVVVKEKFQRLVDAADREDVFSV